MSETCLKCGAQVHKQAGHFDAHVNTCGRILNIREGEDYCEGRQSAQAEANTRIAALEAENAKLRAAAAKVVLAFPDALPEGDDTTEFNIPAYIINELREAAQENKPCAS